jgi:uncharacterized membrane protein YjgN (DUF898 family)
MYASGTPACVSCGRALSGPERTLEPTPTPIPAPLPEHAEFLEFTGDGREYFRIWIVNLFLTVATLGIYSAWAKVRKARYFAQNTRLGGHVFDYHGEPVAILRGRILAVLLFTAYSWAFRFSRTAGLVTVFVLCVLGPWLFMKAQQFKLQNTSFRGLRFGFRSSLGDTYLTLLPVVLPWIATTLTTALELRMRWVGLSFGVWAVLMPWMHHRLKGYQHSRASYGDVAFAFEPATKSFYRIYIGAIVALFVASIAMGIAAVMAAHLSEHHKTVGLIIGLLSGVCIYSAVGPLFAVELQSTVWSHTKLGPVQFRTYMTFGPLFRLVCGNLLLTVLTAGLYWPFMAVALARYRVGCLEVRAAGSVAYAARSVSAIPATAAGDGALDAFGLDVGF